MNNVTNLIDSQAQVFASEKEKDQAADARNQQLIALINQLQATNGKLKEQLEAAKTKKSELLATQDKELLPLQASFNTLSRQDSSSQGLFERAQQEKETTKNKLEATHASKIASNQLKEAEAVRLGNAIGGLRVDIDRRERMLAHKYWADHHPENRH